LPEDFLVILITTKLTESKKMGLWQIMYGIKQSDLDDYIKWFEEDHIAEKMDRPGYSWAAHYQIDQVQNDKFKTVDPGFIAMFGSHNTRTFYDPCPLQLKKTQDEVTRSMIPKRQSAQASILCEEWKIDKSADSPEMIPIHSPWILIKAFDSISNDQLFNAWCCQCFMKEAVSQPGFMRGRKFLGSDSTLKHSLIIECEQPIDVTVNENHDDFNDLKFEEVSQVLARRVWPS
jgi:hypothetical protein